MMIKTRRLRLIPATSQMLNAEVEDKNILSVLLNSHIPETWPPETLKDALPWFMEQLVKNPGKECWFSWYAILENAEPEGNILVGSVGFKGAPDENGMVEIGYSVLEEYQGMSIATEMVSAAAEWALSQNDVKSVTAETTVDNFASIKVLEKCGFQLINRQDEAVNYIRLR